MISTKANGQIEASLADIERGKKMNLSDDLTHENNDKKSNLFKQYLFFWGGQLFSLLGSSIVSFVLILWISFETNSELMLGLASIVSFGPFLIIGPFAGVITDRLNRKMIIIINGSLGVGKSSVSEELHWKFEKSVYLDGDHIGYVHPFEIYDEARIDHLYRTLALLVGFHRENGYQNFVINYVFESPGSLQELLDMLRPLDPSLHVYWLTCEESEQEKRIRTRQRDQLAWELNRFFELKLIQAEASQEGFIGIEVDTTGLTSTEVADYIWKDIHQE